MMRKFLPFLFINLFFIFFNAQAKSSPDVSTESLRHLAADYRKIYISSQAIISKIVVENKLFKENKENIISAEKLFSYTPDLISTQGNMVSKNLPTINWTSEVNYNFSPGFAEEDNIFYRARISSGLDWLVLGEGSGKNKRLENSLRQHASSINLMAKSNDMREHWYSQMRSNLRSAYDLKKIKILSDYENILKLINQLYSDQNKFSLTNAGELARKNHQLNKVSIERRSLEKLIPEVKENLYSFEDMQYLIPDLTPVEDINLDHLVNDKRTALQIQKELLEITKKKEKQLDLRLKLRYNYYSTPLNDRNFASLGASINLPVTNSKTGDFDQAVLNFREKELDNMEKVYRDQLIEIYRQYYELKATVEILESESVYLEADLKVKSENDNSKSFSPAAYLETAEKYLQNQLELCEQKYNLLTKYSQYKMLSQEDEKSHLVSKTLDTDNAGKETYIWSSLFNNYSNEYIINLLNHWNINRVFLSPGNSSNASKVESFKSLAADHNILVYRLIGENSYAASDDGFINLQNALINAKNAGFAGVHLDIEPHTFSDYKDNVDLYSQRLINLFTLSKAWCDQNNMAMGVSVPMHLPVNVASSLYDNEITTYIMAYDNLSLEKKIAKTSAIRNILGNNLYVWVFRINDFENFSDLTDAEATVQSNNITQIGYYDLSQMNNFKP